jgi:hypothetical protein
LRCRRLPDCRTRQGQQGSRDHARSQVTLARTDGKGLDRGIWHNRQFQEIERLIAESAPEASADWVNSEPELAIRDTV